MALRLDLVAFSLAGLQFGVGAINPSLKTPIVYNYTLNVERKISKDIVAVAGYSGSRGTNLLSGGGQQFSVSYGVDINTYAGDLIPAQQHLSHAAESELWRNLLHHR